MMESPPRYEIVDTIAVGDFGTVYRARDRELGREVAIKQIHQQFLHDERQLARYWQEAQLLASLQHPHILTIYDIVRSRGWLIVELMRGSLKQVAQGEPIDLDFLRHGAGLFACGAALPPRQRHHSRRRQAQQPAGRFAESREAGRLRAGPPRDQRRRKPAQGNHQVHGAGVGLDAVRPGGAGLGPVFAGLLGLRVDVRRQFEALFPSLATFGRDKQIAWMMWHAAADRQLPEIGRVLEGVPEDFSASFSGWWSRIRPAATSRRWTCSAICARER